MLMKDRGMLQSLKGDAIGNMSRKNILYIAFMACYDNSKGAGCKVENFYIKELSKNESFQFKLLMFEDFDEEYNDVINDLNAYNIDAEVICRDRDLISKLTRGIVGLRSKYSPFDKYGNFTTDYYGNAIKKHIKKIKREGFYPDCVVLGWTQVILFAEEIRKLLPNTRIIAIEEDVSFLGLERKYLSEVNRFKKILKLNQYNRLRKAELKALDLCDFSYVNNPKDYELLIESGLDKNKISWLAPWYDEYQDKVVRNVNRENPYILYYGAMGRPENYLSAEWLIKNVLDRIDSSIKLYIVGSGAGTVEKYASDRIVVTGFADDVTPYFSGCLCLAAPLVLGAGIKIKVLEAMSAGIPVLTNSIGIEGIMAIDKKDYFHCESAKDYITVINKLLNKEIDVESVSNSAKETVKSKYNYHRSGEFISRNIEKLLEENSR